MATFPVDPNLPAATTSTECDPDFFNSLVDNINAIGEALGDLVNNTADGNIDLATNKGIEWGDVPKIYFSGGDIIIDDGVQISGALAVGGNLAVTGNITGTIDLSGSVDIGGTLTVNTIDDSGAGYITILDNVTIPNHSLSTLLINVNEITEKTTDHGILLSDEVTISENLYLTYPGSGDMYMEIAEGYGPPSDPENNHARLHLHNGQLSCITRYVGVTNSVILAQSAPPVYTVTNDLTDRAYDANTVAVTELADVVGTIIADLQTLGLLG